jgi:phage replication O-like protein O
MVAMASPQRENGFTAIAHELLEAIVAAPLGGGAMRLLMYLARQSYGYNTKTATLSAADFAKATNLHPKVVARELRDLEARRYLVVFREEGRVSTYAIQKDYDQWATGNQKVPGYEKVPTNQTVPGPGTGTFPHREPKGSTPTIEKEIPKEKKERSTEPHGSGVAVPPPPGTLREQFEGDYKAAANKGAQIGVAGVYFGRMLGPPDYGRVGALLKLARSGGALFAAMAEAARQTITDDPHDYVETIVRRELGKERGDGDEGRAATPGERARDPAGGVGRGRAGARGGHRTYRDGDYWPERD